MIVNSIINRDNPDEEKLEVMECDTAHDKTSNKTCVTSKDSDQPGHPPSMAIALVHPILDSPEAVEGTCDQRRL